VSRSSSQASKNHLHGRATIRCRAPNRRPPAAHVLDEEQPASPFQHAVQLTLSAGDVVPIPGAVGDGEVAEDPVVVPHARILPGQDRERPPPTTTTWPVM
jgi:hypothetical protein